MTKHTFRAAIAVAALIVLPAPLLAEGPPQITREQAQAMIKAFKPQQGKIALPDAHATLDLGKDYVFYGPEDAKKIIVDLWGNPPSEGEGLLGLVMPAGSTPASDAWGAVLTYESTGYVSDEDANKTDYAELLSQMQKATEDNNAKRTEAGYPAMHLVGWAENPRYDPRSHAMIWARDLKFTGSAVDSLNYDLRTLGRNGVLSVNFLSGMPQLGSIRAAAAEFANHASFDPGFRYAEFDASIDKKAEYGVGGLIAAGAGLVVAKKLGLLAIMLKFIKPLLLAAAVTFGALRKKIAGLFGRRKDPLEGDDIG